MPRVYLCYHWISDVISGAVIGVALMLVLPRIIGATRLADQIVHFSAMHPPVFYAMAWLLTLELAVLFSDLRRFLLDAAHLAKALI
jgi:undecaprenyl-diphosphatase